LRPLLLITRPAEESAATAKAAALAGFDSLIVPLMAIEALPWTAPDEDFDALLFTSPQAPRHASSLPASLAQLPVYAVGAATAQAADAAGFRVTATGNRNAEAILAAAACDGRQRILHLCGADVVAARAPAELGIRRIAVYRAVLADALAAPAEAALSRGDAFATLLYSARTAQRFAALVESVGLCRADLRIVCLSPAIAAAAGSGWRAAAAAPSPDMAALLAAARALWQGAQHG
jgi:uroporphyrinogen-III synthase